MSWGATPPRQQRNIWRSKASLMLAIWMHMHVSVRMYGEHIIMIIIISSSSSAPSSSSHITFNINMIMMMLLLLLLRGRCSGSACGRTVLHEVGVDLRLVAENLQPSSIVARPRPHALPCSAFLDMLGEMPLTPPIYRYI